MVNLQGEEVLWFVALEDKYVVKTLLKEISDQICNFRARCLVDWILGDRYALEHQFENVVNLLQQRENLILSRLC